MDNSISVSQALNHIQSWMNAGEFDKVVQGCQEILLLEPGNQRALALMKKAEESRHSSQTVEPSTDPLAHLQVENTPSRFGNTAHQGSSAHQGIAFQQDDAADFKLEKRKFFLAMLIPAIVVVILGGSIIWLFTEEKRDDLLADNSQTNTLETNVDTTYLSENETRMDEMKQIKRVLDNYKTEHGSYPSAEQVEAVLVQSEEFSKVPTDPRQGDVDKAGKPFGYVYAVYDSFGKANQNYVLSALFEDSKGFGYPWTSGAPSKNYPDYRNTAGPNATFIGDSQK